MPVSEIDFAELSDGSVVELIEDPTDATKALFAVYCNQSVRYTDRVEDRGKIYVPLSRAHDDLRHVRLAQGAEAYGEIIALEAKVYHLLRACLDLELKPVFLMTAFAISTWLPEKSSVAPYLALVGPPGSGKTTAMRVLNLLCYRSLLTADISSSAFYEISDRIRPTILLDETLTAGRPRELVHLLKASSTQDAVSLRKDKARLAYGPKVFSWLELPNDAALNSRCVIVPMRRTSRTDLKSPSDIEILEHARETRKHLLQFRFEHFRRVGLPKIPCGVPLSARPLDLYRSLALPFGDDPNMCSMLAGFIAEQGELDKNVLSPAQISVLRILYECVHRGAGAVSMPVSELTRAVNRDLGGRGEPHRLNERKMGYILTSLSFTDRARKNTGYVLCLNRSDLVRIHASMRDYGVAPILTASVGTCEFCAQAGTTSPTAESKMDKNVQSESEGERSEHRVRRAHTGRLRGLASSLPKRRESAPTVNCSPQEKSPQAVGAGYAVTAVG